jgi:hypothetical protein
MVDVPKNVFSVRRFFQREIEPNIRDGTKRVHCRTTYFGARGPLEFGAGC